jgi:hypothetical protein
MKSADWAQAIRSKLTSLAKQKMQVQKSLGIDEGWSDHHPDQDYDEYIERLRDEADARRKEKKENPPQDKKDSDSKDKLAEGALDNLKSLLVKAQSLPSISQHMASAKAKLPMIIAAAKKSSGGKDLLAKISSSQTQEGLGGVLSGSALAGTGASLIGMVAELAMRVYISMGSPSYEQLTAQQGSGFLLLAAFAVAGAGAMAIGAGKAVDSARTQTEAATAGATSSGNIASLGQSPHVVLGRSRGQKSYTGSPGKSGTKAPAQPKPRKQTPKDNALNFKGGIIS